MIKILLILILLYFLLLSDFQFTYQSDCRKYQIEYNGLLWVALDFYSIKKYHSNDKLIKWINFKTLSK